MKLVSLLMALVPIMGCSQGPDLEVSVSTPNSTIGVGQEAEFTVTAKNITNSAKSFQTGSGLKLDLRLFRASDGKQAWQWSEGRMFTLAIVEQTLEPGETMKQTMEWKGVDRDGKPIPAGTYWLYPELAQMQPPRVRYEQKPIEITITASQDAEVQSKFDLRGRVLSYVREVPINGGPRLAHLLVESSDPKSMVASARVTIDESTELPDKPLKTGQVVDIVFVGPVTRSIPAQARAAEVRILQEETYHILGTIETLEDNVFLVIASPGSGSTTDQARVRINPDTEMPLKPLKRGMVVAVTFKGPVAQSYPVQANAAKIVIISG